ncbi:MAG: hypothetical protein LH603_22475, partial [Pseudonocardia sp.]|nr:hypothetical protein [Pseudonocardia sp.]
MGPTITLVARLAASAADARRGVVRLHPEVIDALGLFAWDAVTLTGARVTTALVAPGEGPPGQATLDDVTLSNAGLTDGAIVVVTPARVEPARQVRLTGSRLARASLTPETVRLALLGKVVTGGDAVSLLPQDVEPGAGRRAPPAPPGPRPRPGGGGAARPRCARQRDRRSPCASHQPGRCARRA